MIKLDFRARIFKQGVENSYWNKHFSQRIISKDCKDTFQQSKIIIAHSILFYLHETCHIFWYNEIIAIAIDRNSNGVLDTNNDTNYPIKWKVRSGGILILKQTLFFFSKRSSFHDFTNDFTPRWVVGQGGSLKERRNEFALSGGVWKTYEKRRRCIDLDDAIKYTRERVVTSLALSQSCPVLHPLTKDGGSID